MPICHACLGRNTDPCRDNDGHSPLPLEQVIILDCPELTYSKSFWTLIMSPKLVLLWHSLGRNGGSGTVITDSNKEDKMLRRVSRIAPLGMCRYQHVRRPPLKAIGSLQGIPNCLKAEEATLSRTS